jgi:hypothetical protein
LHEVWGSQSHSSNAVKFSNEKNGYGPVFIFGGTVGHEIAAAKCAEQSFCQIRQFKNNLNILAVAGRDN